MRVRKQGLRGLEASTIGLTLVGYIAAGFLIGQWLDGHFKTAFWMPLLVLVGTGAGFRDILKIVTRMGAQSRASGEDRAVGRPMMAPADISGTATKAHDAETEVADDRPRPRIFSVPPPPKASFEQTTGENAGRSTPGLFSSGNLDETALDGTDDEALIEKLLAEEKLDDDETRPKNNKKDSETKLS